MFSIHAQTTPKKVANAIRNKSLASLKDALNEFGLNINPAHVLSEVMASGWEEGTQLLLERPEIPPNLLMNLCYDTPLHFVIYKSLLHLKLFRILLNSEKVNVNAKNEQDETALLMALRLNPPNAVHAIKCILSHKALELPPFDVHRALSIAAAQTSPEVLNLLFSHPRIHNVFLDFLENEIQEIWHAAKSNCNMEAKTAVALKILIRSFREDSHFTLEEAKTLLPGLEDFPQSEALVEHAKKIAAAYSDDVFFCIGFSVVQECFQQKDTLDGTSLLHRAVEYFYSDEQLPFIENLFKNENFGINEKITSAGNETALHLAIQQQKRSLVKFLLTQNIDFASRDSNGNTPLHLAMRFNDDEIVLMLLQHLKTEEMHLQNHAGNTPLQLGLKYGNVEACKVFLTHQPPTTLFSTNHKGQTIFHCAAQSQRNAELMPLLLEKNQMTAEQFNLTDQKGNTPLHWATQRHLLTTVKFLIEKKIDINATTEDSKKTPLHIAADHFAEYPMIFFALLRTPNIDTSMKDINGDTAFQIILNMLTDKDTSMTKKLKVARMSYLLFNDSEVEQTLQHDIQKTLLTFAISNDHLALFKIFSEDLNRLGYDIPHPEKNPRDFTSHVKMCLSHRITAYYAILSVLKKNPNHRDYEALLTQLHEEMDDPTRGYDHPMWSWSKEVKDAAFERAKETVNANVFSADLFALTVFACDGYLQHPKHPAPGNTSGQRFFRIIEELPIVEVQMNICNAVYAEPRRLWEEFILSKDSELAFQRLAKTFHR